MSLAVYHPQSSEAQRELEMDFKLPFGSAAWQPRWKRRRSERGPISIAVRALLELPKEIVEEILRLVNWRYLEDNPSEVIPIRGWAGTHRMVNFNRMYSKGMWSNQVLGTRRPSWIELLQSLTGP